MKKILAMILALVMCLSLCACGSEESNNNIETTQETISEEQIKERLDSIAKDLRDANEYFNRISSILLENWSSYHYFTYFYDQAKYEKDRDEQTDLVQDACDEKFKYQKMAQEKLEAALAALREISPTENTDDYYKALKAYYTELKTYESLVTNWPQGHSKLTYSQAITDAKSATERACDELEFYK